MRDPLVYREVRLGPLDEAHLNLYARWRNSWDVRQTTREFKVLDAAMQRRWFEGLHGLRYPDHLMFEIRAPSLSGSVSQFPRVPSPVGIGGLTYIDWKNRSAEVSVYIGDPEARSKGIGTAAVTCLVHYAFDELALHRVWAEVYGFNEDSLHLFGGKALNFPRVAEIPDTIWRGGQWWSSLIFSLNEGQYRKGWKD